MSEQVTNPATDTNPAAAASTPVVAETATAEKPAEVQAPPAAAAPAAPATDAPKPDAKADESAEKPASEDKEAEAAKPAAPEKYDLKLPENSLLDSTNVEKIAAYAKQNGLSNAEAQEILDGEHKSVVAFVEQRKAAWITQAQADKEIGGDGLNRNVELASRVVNRYGSETLKNELNKSGYGNHPELVRLLVRVGREMSEDQLLMPGTQGGAGKKSIEDIFYGNQNKN